MVRVLLPKMARSSVWWMASSWVVSRLWMEGARKVWMTPATNPTSITKKPPSESTSLIPFLALDGVKGAVALLGSTAHHVSLWTPLKATLAGFSTRSLKVLAS